MAIGRVGERGPAAVQAYNRAGFDGGPKGFSAFGKGIGRRSCKSIDAEWQIGNEAPRYVKTVPVRVPPPVGKATRKDREDHERVRGRRAPDCMQRMLRECLAETQRVLRRAEEN